MELSDYQRDILIRTALGEAAGEGKKGMEAVLHVILNRANSGKYPSDPASVALQSNQFSAWNPETKGGNNPSKWSPNSKSYKTAAAALDNVLNSNVDPTYGALYYHAKGITPYWADSVNKHGVQKIGNHVFYAAHPVPPGNIPQVASQLDVTPPRVKPASLEVATSRPSNSVPPGIRALTEGNAAFGVLPFASRPDPSQMQMTPGQNYNSGLRGVFDPFIASIGTGLGMGAPGVRTQAAPPITRAQTMAEQNSTRPKPVNRGFIPLPAPPANSGGMRLHPFDPAINKPRPNPDGSYSTEITRTVQFPDGSWANVPSLWWDSGSTSRDFGSMTDDQLAGLAQRYEAQSGKAFPRYKSVGQAETAARDRSAAGGGTQGAITRNFTPLPAPPPLTPQIASGVGTPNLTTRTVSTVPIDPITGLPRVPAPSLQEALQEKAARIASGQERFTSPTAPRSDQPGVMRANTVGVQPAGSVQLPPNVRPAAVDRAFAAMSPPPPITMADTRAEQAMMRGGVPSLPSAPMPMMPTVEMAAMRAPALPPVPMPARPASLSGGQSYQIRSGDTLSQIAQRSGLSVAQIMALNPSITNPNVIRAGASLNLSGRAPSAPRPVTTIAQAPAPKATVKPASYGSKGYTPTDNSWFLRVTGRA